jgi:hypothetical protein
MMGGCSYTSTRTVAWAERHDLPVCAKAVTESDEKGSTSVVTKGGALRGFHDAGDENPAFSKKLISIDSPLQRRLGHGCAQRRPSPQIVGRGAALECSAQQRRTML